MSEDLKPCPFCGGEPEVGRTKEMWDDKKGYPKFGISCPDKKCFGYNIYCLFSSYGDAFKAWNTRFDENKQPPP